LSDFNDAKNAFTNTKFQQPQIHINIGNKMKITRILNRYLTPVFSDKISKEQTGPGQMSKDEILEIRTKLGLESDRRLFYLIGSPITLSPSPTFHNKIFSLMNLPYEYKRYGTGSADSALYIINKPETVGCSITIPLKCDLYEAFKAYASPDVEYIKAINTIIKIDGKIKIYNTDWVCIYNLLLKKLSKIYKGSETYRTRKILIIGAGGTSLAAIFAVLKLQCIPIIYNRKISITDNLKFMKDIWSQNGLPQY